MRRVKTQRRPDTAAEGRLRQVRVRLGLGRELPLAWLADRASIPRSTLKNAAARDSLSQDVAEAIADLFEDDQRTTVKWLQGRDGMAPERPKMAPISPIEPRSITSRTPMASESEDQGKPPVTQRDSQKLKSDPVRSRRPGTPHAAAKSATLLTDRWKVPQLRSNLLRALQTDLEANEFGQWSRPDAQQAIIWALKDLTRQLSHMGFRMEQMFLLTDEWARAVGLPSYGWCPEGHSAPPQAKFCPECGTQLGDKRS